MQSPEEDDGDVMVTTSLSPPHKQLPQKPTHCLVKEKLTCRYGRSRGGCCICR